MKNLKPVTRKSVEENIPEDLKYGSSIDRCDLMLNPLGWETGSSQYKGFAVENGKVVFEASDFMVDFREYVHSMRLLEYDIKTMSYTILQGMTYNSLARFNGATITEVANIPKGSDTTRSLVYQELSLTLPPEAVSHPLGTEGNTWRGNIIEFGLAYGLNFDDASHLACFYRLDTKKTYCTKPVPWTYNGSHGEQASMGHADFEGHVLLWQHSNRSILNARDMECYCDWNPELCPFDDYTPNTEHPKRDGFRDERCEDKTKCDYTDIP